ncbi:hypothetical protein DLJ53_17140 [Acuticoccus sediminis]|uniref:Uncharacterized protein n=1 Tax=Acuticoccus sediminis TaxID=2184697 RepID=A0A8B2NUV6_9HYPH|nr:hypothetical protein [Acuticoccus sediminis]RAI00953.1 hypothetical protein DLJ53_17140 [Acuticoccus sediminis]
MLTNNTASKVFGGADAAGSTVRERRDGPSDGIGSALPRLRSVATPNGDAQTADAAARTRPLPLRELREPVQEPADRPSDYDPSLWDASAAELSIAPAGPAPHTAAPVALLPAPVPPADDLEGVYVEFAFADEDAAPAPAPSQSPGVKYGRRRTDRVGTAPVYADAKDAAAEVRCTGSAFANALLTEVTTLSGDAPAKVGTTIDTGAETAAPAIVTGQAARSAQRSYRF